MLYKEQVIYAIYKLMDEYEIDDVDFVLNPNQPKYKDNGIEYTVVIIDKPDMETKSFEVTRIPSYSFRLDYRTHDSVETKLNVLEHMFRICYEYVQKAYEEKECSKEEADKALEAYCEDYLSVREDFNNE